jgi:acyl carrier protein
VNTSAPPVALSSLVALVRQVVIDLPPEQVIQGSSRFIEDIGMESVNRLMLMTLVEQEYELSLEAHMPVLIELQTVQQFADFLDSLTVEK